jgi:hypothetical protein
MEIVHKTEEKTHRKLRNVESLISAREKERVVKKIFHKDEEDYKRIITLLNNMTNWTLAFRLIKWVFLERRVDPFSRDASKFTNLIYLRYFPEELEKRKLRKFLF